MMIIVNSSQLHGIYMLKLEEQKYIQLIIIEILIYVIKCVIIMIFL